MMQKINACLILFFIMLSYVGYAQTEKLALTYVMDPQCSWCYGNSSNIEEIATALGAEVDVTLRVGGMWLGEEAPRGGSTYFSNITQHLPSMIAKTGAEIGSAYYDLASEPSYVFSSLEPAAAIVLVRELDPKKTFRFAKYVEQALYKEGKRLDKLATYSNILDNLDIDQEAFKNRWMQEENIAETRADFKRARALASTFPSLVLQQGDEHKVIGVGYFTKDDMLPIVKAALNEVK